MRPIHDEDLERAATAFVRTCLRVVAGERLVLVGDAESQAMLSALEAAGRAASADVSALRIDQLRSQSTNHSGERPHKVLPDAVRRAMLSAQASAFIASSPHAETSMRDQLLHVVGACRVRHAHMPGIAPLAFASGLAADFDELAERGAAIGKRLAGAREITTESAEGTRLVIRCSRPWVSRLGVVEPGESITLPAGSLFATPESISGTFAATASVGEFFGAREGLLREPVVFEIASGLVMNVTAPGCPDLVRDIETMLHVAPGSDRVGLVIVGVNAAIGEPTGDALVDQHRPGLHLVFGDPSPKLTGATWSARTAFTACQARATVRVDGATLVEDGKLSTS